MTYFIGTDEAGYGPNLGPLVIASTVWRVPDAPLDTDLYELLNGVVARHTGDSRLAIADSKALYKPGGGLTSLENAVLASLADNEHPLDWRTVWESLSPDSLSQLETSPWHAQYNCPVPIDADIELVEELKSFFFAGLELAGTSLETVRACAVFPQRFNDLLDAHGTKGAVLSHLTLQLVAGLLESLDDEAVLVTCDKHGGRNRYVPVLQPLFAEHLIEVRRESRPASIYRWGPEKRRIEMRFVTGGESFLPAALASMTAKYLRELAMRSFNQFWCSRMPGLKPTAGYPVDARRFREEIDSLVREMGIKERVLWRRK